MRYQIMRDLGISIDTGYSILADTAISFCLCCVICGISWALLKKGYFRANIFYLVLVGVLLVLPEFLWALPEGMTGNYIFLLVCVWDHYWARVKTGNAPMSPGKARRVQAAMAVILTLLWGVCRLKVGVFTHLNEASLFVAAVYLWVHTYYHRNDTEKARDSLFL